MRPRDSVNKAQAAAAGLTHQVIKVVNTRYYSHEMRGSESTGRAVSMSPKDMKVESGRDRTQLPLVPNALLVLHHVSVLW